MTWQKPPRYTTTLTRKQKEAAYNSQRPLDAPPRELKRPLLKLSMAALKKPGK